MKFNILEDHDFESGELTPPRQATDEGQGLLQIAPPRERLSVADLRAKLAGKQGRYYWRSLEEIAETPQFTDMLHREFPRHASEWDSALDRRKFLTLMGASLALAGFAGCSEDANEKLVPYVEQPEQLVPGQPMYYATAMPRRGGAMGLLAESHIGRPTKLEGNEEHPGSLGSSDLHAQAAILAMYDPDRAQTVKYLGAISTWEAFLEDLRPRMAVEAARGGAQLRVLTESVISPTLTRQLEALFKKYPDAKWHQYDPICNDNVVQGAQLAYDQVVDAIYHFDRADVVLSLDSDFMADGGSSVRYARDLASRRQVSADDMQMNRLYVIEGTPSCTGAIADSRWPLRSGQIGGFVQELAKKLSVDAASSFPAVTADASPGGFDPASDQATAWLAAVAEDLQAAAGKSIVVVGRNQPSWIHALVHAINDSLGNVGEKQPIEFIEPIAAKPIAQVESLAELTKALEADEVSVLLMLEGNPVYDAPADLRFKEQLERFNVPADKEKETSGFLARIAIHLSEIENETSELSQWQLPRLHFLESWSDTQAFDGTASVIQPLIAPLYRGVSAHQVISAVVDASVRDDFELVQETWKTILDSNNFEARWRKSIHDGLLPETAANAISSSLKLTAEALNTAREAQASPVGGEIELGFSADPSLDDGRWANNAWLQEVPKPWTKLCWGNALLLAPGTADKLEVANGDLVEITRGDRKIKAAVWQQPGQALGQATLHLGYGRTHCGSVGDGVGYDAYPLRTSDAMWIATDGKIVKTGEHESLATTQGHDYLAGRDIIREATLDEYRADPHRFDIHGHGAPVDRGPEDIARDGDGSSRELAAKDATPGVAGDHSKGDHDDHAHHGIIAENGKPITMLEDRQAQQVGPQWGMSIDLSTCMGCNACVVACQSENNIPVVGKEGIERSREMQWIRIDRYFAGDVDAPNMLLQPMLCQHCEKAPCELVCPVAATTHSPGGINEMTYNRCIGTRYCSNNCPYKVRRFNFFDYTNDAPVLDLLRNPDVTVRTRGVMEKCTYCIQRISNARIAAKVRDAKQGTNDGIRDGEVVTACQSACPTQAIAFGDISDPKSRVSQAKAQPRDYAVLEELGVVPRTTYLGVVRNPHPKLLAWAEAQAERRAAVGDQDSRIDSTLIK